MYIQVLIYDDEGYNVKGQIIWIKVICFEVVTDATSAISNLYYFNYTSTIMDEDQFLYYDEPIYLTCNCPENEFLFSRGYLHFHLVLLTISSILLLTRQLNASSLSSKSITNRLKGRQTKSKWWSLGRKFWSGMSFQTTTSLFLGTCKVERDLFRER